MKHKLYQKLTAAACALALLLSLTPSAFAAGGPTASSNINKQDYTTYGSPVSSYLYDNGRGLTRVEYTGKAVVVEDYDSSFNLTDSRTISMELPVWGGFFAGADANYLIFGQENLSESSSAEVIRVVKYSKSWQKQGSVSIKGAYTQEPFHGGSLRCAEYGGYLYIHASRTMFRNALNGIYNIIFDTLANHQANLTLEIRESDMTLVDSFDAVGNLDFGYVSHSFNQFILIDQDKNIVTLDHSDSNSDANGRANYGYAQAVASRGVDLIRYDEKAGQDHFRGKAANQRYQWTEFSLVQGFGGSSGNNTTGASVGGFAETSGGYVSAFNYDGAGGSGARNVYIGYTAKSGLKSTSAKISTAAGTTTPQLVSTGLDGGYIMWNGKSGYTANDTLYYVTYSDGGRTGSVQTATAPLSDCQPISYNGRAVWYVTNNSAPVFYGLDASGVTVLGGSVPSAQDPDDGGKPDDTSEPEDTGEPDDATKPDDTTKPADPTKPITPTPEEDEYFKAHNIDPNSPRIGDVLGGTSSCEHSYPNSTRWYWSGAAGTTSCTENAYSYYTCSICGAKIVNGLMFAPGHQYKDGVCTVCGAADPAAPAKPSTSGSKWSGVISDINSYFGTTNAILSDGTLKAWYSYTSMQGKSVTDSYDLRTIGGGYQARTAASLLKSDGTLWLFDAGPLYEGDGVFQYGSNVKQASPDGEIVLKNDGTVWSRILPSGESFAYVDIAKVTDNAKQVSQYGNTFYVLKNDGTLWSWGNGAGLGRNQGKDDKKMGKVMDNVAFIAPSMALKTDGSVWAWGQEMTVGNGSKEASAAPVKIMDNAVGIWSDGLRRFVVTQDGSLYSWGECGAWKTAAYSLGYPSVDKEVKHNAAASVGFDYTEYYQSVPRKVDVDDVVAVAFSGSTLVVQKSDGSLWAYGDIGSLPCRTVEGGEEEIAVAFIKFMDGVKLPEAVAGSGTKPAETTAPGTTAPSTASKLPFTDVPANAYYTDAVAWALEKGITNGATATTFEPNASCERGQVATFLWRAKGCPEPKTKTNPFRDVPASSPYYKAILWAYENGIINGTSATTFEPYATCTNGHVVTMLWRAEGKPAASGTSSIARSFPTDFYTDAVAWADTTGLLKDTGASFDPNVKSPRSNIVTYLYRNLAE